MKGAAPQCRSANATLSVLLILVVSLLVIARALLLMRKERAAR